MELPPEGPVAVPRGRAGRLPLFFEVVLRVLHEFLEGPAFVLHRFQPLVVILAHCVIEDGPASLEVAVVALVFFHSCEDLSDGLENFVLDLVYDVK